MSDEIKDVGDVDPNAGGEKGKVSYESYEKVLKQRKADQEKFKALEEKLNIFTQKEAEANEAKLQDEGKWREALELKNQQLIDREKKISDLESSVNSLESSFDEATRLQAVAEKLPGRIKKKEYYNFIDTSKIITDPETGALDETSIAEVANGFIKDYSELLEIPKGKAPPADGANSMTSFTIEQYKNMSLADKKKNLAAMVEKRNNS